MDDLAKRFPFLTESTILDDTARFLTGTLNGDDIKISQMFEPPQYMLSINDIFLVMSVGSTDEIITVLTKLQRKEKVEPNQEANQLVKMLRGLFPQN